jgi:GT2 family glycosyltransferase
MDLSIIIVNYRGWSYLSECLDPLRGLSDLISSEVIIADNNSADGKLEDFKSRYPGFKFISNDKNGGFAYGCNKGSSDAKGDYLLFLNPDTVAEPAAIAQLLERSKDRNDDHIISCRQTDRRGRESKAWGLFPGFGTLTGPGRSIYRKINAANVKETPEAGKFFFNPDWVSGSVIMIPAATFNKIGGFDEDYWMYSEDTDICRRVRNIGGSIIFFTDISIRHDHGRTSRVNLKTTSMTKTEVMISGHVYLSKHKMGFSGFILQSWLILYNVVTGFFSAVIGAILFFKPKMLAKTLIFLKLLVYYIQAIRRLTWVSRMSVNYGN